MYHPEKVGGCSRWCEVLLPHHISDYLFTIEQRLDSLTASEQSRRTSESMHECWNRAGRRTSGSAQGGEDRKQRDRSRLSGRAVELKALLPGRVRKLPG